MRRANCRRGAHPTPATAIRLLPSPAGDPLSSHPHRDVQPSTPQCADDGVMTFETAEDEKSRSDAIRPATSPSAGGGASPLQSRRPISHLDQRVGYARTVLWAHFKAGRIRLCVGAASPRLTNAGRSLIQRVYPPGGMVTTKDRTSTVADAPEWSFRICDRCRVLRLMPKWSKRCGRCKTRRAGSRVSSGGGRAA